MASAAVDFARLMPDVAARLLGEPNKAMSREPRLRFGTHGSMENDTAEGWFDDHEAGVRGGVLDLIRHKRGCDAHGALSWLEAEGLKATREPELRTPTPPTFYDYRDAARAVAYRVERRGKGMVPPFLQHGPDGRGGFAARKGGMQGVASLPYRLPELLAAPADAIVFVCEGEKDADRLAREGLVATTNSGGAGKFAAALVPHFEGRRVVVLADNDEPGERHALDVAEKLRGVAAAVAIVRLGGAEKADVSDWLVEGGSAFQLVHQFAEPALADANAPPETFPLADLAIWSQTAATPTPFYMTDRIPAGELTLLTGDGGGNKSTFGQQLATCSAAGLPMLGVNVRQGRALYVTAEDHADRLHWMQEHICRALGVGMASLAGRLHLASIRGRMNNELATFDHDGRLKPQEAFRTLRATLIATRADLLVLDNVAHLFAGNENDRGQVTAFVNLLYALCGELGVTILLIAHRTIRARPMRPPRPFPITKIRAGRGRPAWSSRRPVPTRSTCCASG